MLCDSKCAQKTFNGTYIKDFVFIHKAMRFDKSVLVYSHFLFVVKSECFQPIIDSHSQSGIGRDSSAQIKSENNCVIKVITIKWNATKWWIMNIFSKLKHKIVFFSPAFEWIHSTRLLRLLLLLLSLLLLWLLSYFAWFAAIRCFRVAVETVRHWWFNAETNKILCLTWKYHKKR